jgi:hypothetical protein
VCAGRPAGVALTAPGAPAAASAGEALGAGGGPGLGGAGTPGFARAEADEEEEAAPPGCMATTPDVFGPAVLKSYTLSFGLGDFRG